MKKIIEIIGGTQEQYKALLLSNYMQWCEIQAHGCDRTLQKIMIDQAINKWYLGEFKKLEASFLKTVNPLKESKYINYSLMKSQYLATIQLIRRIYPKPLLVVYARVQPQLSTFNYN